jgi:hypothetical protein
LIEQTLPERMVLPASRVRWICYGVLLLCFGPLALSSNGGEQVRYAFIIGFPMLVLAVIRPKSPWITIIAYLVAAFALRFLLDFLGPQISGGMISGIALILAIACILVSSLAGSKLLLDRQGFEFVDFWWFRRRVSWTDIPTMPELGRRFLAVRLILRNRREVEFLQGYGLENPELVKLLRRFHASASSI